jgi:hypothetical protein
MAADPMRKMLNRTPGNAWNSTGVPPGGYNLKYRAVIEVAAFTKAAKGFGNEQKDILRKIERASKTSQAWSFRVYAKGSIPAMNNRRKKISRHLRDAMSDGGNAGVRFIRGRAVPKGETLATMSSGRAYGPHGTNSQGWKINMYQGKANPDTGFKYAGPHHDKAVGSFQFGNNSGSDYWFYKGSEKIRVAIAREMRVIQKSNGVL